MRTVLLCFLLCVFSILTKAQTSGDYRTRASGSWTATGTWQVFAAGDWQNLENPAAGIYQNVIPSIASGEITVTDNITIANSITADQLAILSGITEILVTGSLIINNGSGDDLMISGSGSITGAGVLTIGNDATYNHNRNGGMIPLASWSVGSTCMITGILDMPPALNPLSSYYNFEWRCMQTENCNLGGNVRNVAGNFLIKETNSSQLQLSTSNSYTLNINGDLNVTGNSRIAFGTSTGTFNVNVQGNFNYTSSSITASALKSSGTCNFNVGKNFSVAAGSINFSSGVNATTVTINGNYVQSSGTVLTESSSGIVVLHFNGSTSAQTITASGTISNDIDFKISNALGAELGAHVTVPASFIQSAGAGDVDLNDFRLTINGDFSQEGGAIGISSSSEFVLQGNGVLPISNINFNGTDLNLLEINQTGTLTTSSAITIHRLHLLKGVFTALNVSIADGGIIEREAGSVTQSPIAIGVYDLIYTNTTSINTGPELSSITTLRHLTKQGSGTTALNQALVIVNGDFKITAGSFDVSTNAISVNGNFINDGSMASAPGALFTFTGASSSLTGSVVPSFRNLAVKGNFTAFLNYNVAENYYVDVGAVVHAGTALVTFNGTTLFVNEGTANLAGITLPSGSSFTAPATVLGIAGSMAVTGGTTPAQFNSNGGTILFNGNTVLSGTAVKVFNNVMISGAFSSAAAWTINGNLVNDGSLNVTGVTTFGGTSCLISGTGVTLLGSIVILSGASLVANSPYSMSGNFTGTGNFTALNLVTFTGSTAMSGAGTKSFIDFTVNAGATFNPSVAYTVSGNIIVNGTLADPNNKHIATFDGATLISGKPVLIVFDKVTINATKSVRLECDVTMDNALIGNGSFISTANVTFTGLTMSGTGSKTFNHITVGAGTFTPNASYTIAGNLIVNGTLAAGNSTTTFNGTTSISGGGSVAFNFLTITGKLISTPGVISVDRDFTNNGIFQHNNGTVSLSKAGSNQLLLLGSSGIVFYNLIVNGISNFSVDVINAVNPGTSVDIAGTLSFGEVNAVIDADGSGSSVFRFLSTSDNPATDARIAPIIYAGSNIIGNFTVQRYVSSENRIYRYISSPVVGAQVSQLKDAIPVTGIFSDPSDESSIPSCIGCNKVNPSLFSYNEISNAYAAFPASGLAGASTFTNGRGYSAFFRHSGVGAVGNVTISFTGINPSTSGVVLPVSPTTNGFSLVGNPYPSPIVWNDGGGWTKTNIADVIVVRDNATGILQSHGTADNFIIAPGQSFWVQSSDTGASLQINENAKSTIGTYAFYRMKQPIVDQMEIQLTQLESGITDNARISLISGSSVLYDSFDGVKFDNSIDNGSAVTQVHDISFLSSDATPKALAINAIPLIDCGDVFAIKITNLANTQDGIVTYSLNVNPTGSLKAVSWMLHDNYTNTDTDVSAHPVYTFTVDNLNSAEAASKASNRFTLTAVSAPSIDVTKLVTSPATVCETNQVVLQLESQNGFTYDLDINGVEYSNVEQGNGGMISVFVESNKLAFGSNIIKVKANSACNRQFLINSVVIDKVGVDQVNSVKHGSSCQAGSVTLSASSSATMATYRWYASAISSEVLGTDSLFVTPVLSDTTAYFVAAVNRIGCEGSRRVVYANISDASAQLKVFASDPTTCKGGTIIFSAISPFDGTFNWYESATSVDIINSNAIFETAPLLKNRKYYVSLTSNMGCEGSRREVIAKVTDFNPDLAVTNGLNEGRQICEGQSYTFTVSGAPANATYTWFESMDSMNSIVESNHLITPLLNDTKTYYIAAKNEYGCYSDRWPVKAVVDKFHPKTDISYAYDKICKNDVTSIRLAGIKNKTTYRWYESASSKNNLHEGINFTTDIIGGQVNYYVAEVNSNGCEGERIKLIINPIEFPDPYIVETLGMLASNFVLDNQWYYNDEIIVGETGQILSINFPGSYNLKVQYNGCSEWATPIVKNSIFTGLEDEVTTAKIYPNPVSEMLFVRINERETVKAQLISDIGKVILVDLKSEAGGWRGELDVSLMGKGLYILHIFSEKKSVTHKVIIK